MSFKLSKISIEETRREIRQTIGTIEVVTGTATLDPYIPITQVIANTVSYTVTLPNAEPGTRKVIVFVSQGETNVTVEYNDPYNIEDTDTQELSNVGDVLVFYATPQGWQNTGYYD
jgi:hypothetical protein